jgi:hypothetical protein
MPILSGWDFLKIYDKFEKSLRDRLKIYILSSSIDHRDKELACRDRNVIDHMEKPLSREHMEHVMSNLKISR